MSATTPVILHDLIFATRLARPTGVERVAINTFIASAARNPDAIALVSDRSRVPADLPVIEVGHYATGWLTAHRHIPRNLRDRAVMVCGSAPASPSMRLNHIPIARIIADDFPWKRAEQMSLQGRLLFRDCENWMLDRYAAILTISEIAQIELQRTLGRDIGLAGCATGIDPDAAAERPDSITTKKPILLLVGTVEPRKNYEALSRITTPALLHRWQVVLVGRAGWKGADDVVQALVDRGEGDVTWLRDASDAHLRWLYRHADTFLSLSLAEGFNMPLVEAGSQGLKVVCSDLPIHRSVAPPWAKFVPIDVDAPAVQRILDSPSHPTREDIEQYAQRYAWDTVCDNVESPLIAHWKANRPT